MEEQGCELGFFHNSNKQLEGEYLHNPIKTLQLNFENVVFISSYFNRHLLLLF